jgi:acyl-CoA thioesterase-1
MVFGEDKILFLGDSLTEGYGIDKEFSYPSELSRILKANGHKYTVITGGVSGTTTASGKSRLKWFLKSKPKILVVALGANDGLRGINLDQSQKNLEGIIELAQKNKLIIFLAGMELPPNYGKEYTQKFKEMFSMIIKKYSINKIPFLLEGVAGKKEFNIQDGIHPNIEGHKILAKTVYKYLKVKL